MIRTAAIIPARGGSKGIKDKNIVEVAGKPLIHYVVETCFNTPEIDIVVVSTDSKKIKNVVIQEYPEAVIVDRPSELANDKTTSEEALFHCIEVLDEKFPKIENILFVQATSPLSESGDFSNMLRALEAYDSVGFYSEDFGFFFDRDDLTKPRLPRQQRLPLKREAGNAWAFKKNGFVKNKSRLFGEIGLCEIDYLKALEIDEPADLELIGCVLNSGI